MSEFSIIIDQNLIDKTLNQVPGYPYPVIKYPSAVRGKKVADAPLPDLHVTDVLPNAYPDFDTLGNKALALLDEESESLKKSKDGNVSTVFLKYDAERQRELRSMSYEEMTSDECHELQVLDFAEQIMDTMELGLQVSAKYVLDHKGDFDAALVLEAQQIMSAKTLGAAEIAALGGFFGKIKNAISNAVRTIGNWLSSQIKKLIEFGTPKIENLVINLMTRPTIKVGNPIVIKNLDLRVATLRVVIPYKLFGGGWKNIVFTINDAVELDTSGVYKLSTEGMKIMVEPRFDRVIIKVKILGLWFTFNVTIVANLILAQVGKILVYDATNLITPLRVKDFKYTLERIETVNSNRSLTIEIFIKVSR